MDEAEATGAPALVPVALAEPAGPVRAGGLTTCAAILIAGAAVFILWTPDEPPPPALRGDPGTRSRWLASRRDPGARSPGLAQRSVVPAGPALLTEVLPAAADRAKDLGLNNIAYNLPLVVGPLIAGVVLGLMNSHPALFAVVGVVTLGAAATAPRGRVTS